MCSVPRPLCFVPSPALCPVYGPTTPLASDSVFFLSTPNETCLGLILVLSSVRSLHWCLFFWRIAFCLVCFFSVHLSIFICVTLVPCLLCLCVCSHYYVFVHFRSCQFNKVHVLRIRPLLILPYTQHVTQKSNIWYFYDCTLGEKVIQRRPDIFLHYRLFLYCQMRSTRFISLSSCCFYARRASRYTDNICSVGPWKWNSKYCHDVLMPLWIAWFGIAWMIQED